MKRTPAVAVILSAALLNCALAQSPTQPSKASNTSAKAQPKANTQPDVGQRKFDANCSRCHSAPEQLSPRLTGTVVRHMRVRANLSAQDERDILRFLAP